MGNKCSEHGNVDCDVCEAKQALYEAKLREPSERERAAKRAAAEEAARRELAADPTWIPESVRRRRRDDERGFVSISVGALSFAAAMVCAWLDSNGFGGAALSNAAAAFLAVGLLAFLASLCCMTY